MLANGARLLQSNPEASWSQMNAVIYLDLGVFGLGVGRSYCVDLGCGSGPCLGNRVFGPGHGNFGLRQTVSNRLGHTLGNGHRSFGLLHALGDSLGHTLGGGDGTFGPALRHTLKNTPRETLGYLAFGPVRELGLLLGNNLVETDGYCGFGLRNTRGKLDDTLGNCSIDLLHGLGSGFGCEIGFDLDICTALLTTNSGWQWCWGH